ncbi:MAG: sulfotransferase family protein [Verrucomicrobiae bacterium]|nr:sulfotransferase family protein [Verrucomicrobiae bacterium]MCP5542193.1 sulfotransferase family protein [Akkermansiaceae bacterium]MCP5552004.1 sulfotransferase family protein [Akkermansiaceae bacterium]
MTRIVNLLSGPRNVSTALMYAFAQRGDTAVIDEPLYGHYLHLTHAPQPHWEEMLALLETDGEKVVRERILNPPAGRAVWFVKNMAHHLIDLDPAWLSDPRVANVFLIRDPRQMLPSLVNQIAEPTPRDAAYARQAELFRELDAAGRAPLVLDSRELLLDPGKVLGELCRRIGVLFDPVMLSWKAGPRPEDGPWAKYWYHNLHRSTGFAPFTEKKEPFPERLRPLLDDCLPHYNFLAARAIRAGG